MKITKEAYEILKPAARSYWVAMNESTKSITPATAKLREALLAKNDIPSNLALIEMMVQEEGEVAQNDNAGGEGEIETITNAVVEGKDSDKEIPGDKAKLDEEEKKTGSDTKEKIKELWKKIINWVKGVKDSIATWAKKMWEKHKAFSILYAVIILGIAVLAALYVMNRKDDKKSKLLLKLIAAAAFGGAIVALIQYLSTLFGKKKETTTAKTDEWLVAYGF